MGTKTSKPIRRLQGQRSLKDAGLSSPLPTLNTTQSVLDVSLDPTKKLFGIPLELAAQRSDEKGLIPSPIRQSIEFLEKKGLKYVGLYRISGSSKRIQELINLYDRGERVEFSETEDVHNIVGVIKSFLRELPEPIFTNAARADFRNADDILDDGARLMTFRSIVSVLPPSNRETLSLLVRHLARVALYSDENKMTPTNLSVSICPELGSVFTAMIQNADTIFTKRALSAQFTAEEVRHNVMGHVPLSVSSPPAPEYEENTIVPPCGGGGGGGVEKNDDLQKSRNLASHANTNFATPTPPLRPRGATVASGGRF
eukprot:TRINITY_DN3703_c0_g1_i1.p1 TRINITY_DN3703_c0_g1~~TRINITY_DN3703_c0_g1_i1.p1  ORF type:complete len:314 (+),score=70.46 TRINITY_DN3703_c0_g1_i1:25-966(+)